MIPSAAPSTSNYVRDTILSDLARALAKTTLPEETAGAW
jgi:hypothetical protein